MLLIISPGCRRPKIVHTTIPGLLMALEMKSLVICQLKGDYIYEKIFRSCQSNSQLPLGYSKITKLQHINNFIFKH